MADTTQNGRVRLPAEIFYHIIPSILPDNNDDDWSVCQGRLATMCKVNTLFRKIAQPLLYQQIQVPVLKSKKPFSRLACLIHTLQLRPDLGRLVKRVRLEFIPKEFIKRLRAAGCPRYRLLYPVNLGTEDLLDILFSSTANLEDLCLLGSSVVDHYLVKPRLRTWSSKAEQLPRLKSISLVPDHRYEPRNSWISLEEIDYFMRLAPGGLDRIYSRRCNECTKLRYYTIALNLTEIVLEDCMLEETEFMEFAISFRNLRRFKYTAGASSAQLVVSPRRLLDVLAQYAGTLTDLHLRTRQLYFEDWPDDECFQSFASFTRLKCLTVYPCDFENRGGRAGGAIATLPASLETFGPVRWSNQMAKHIFWIDDAASEGQFPNLEALEVGYYTGGRKFSIGDSDFDVEGVRSQLFTLPLRIMMQ